MTWGERSAGSVADGPDLLLRIATWLARGTARPRPCGATARSRPRSNTERSTSSMAAPLAPRTHPIPRRWRGAAHGNRAGSTRCPYTTAASRSARSQGLGRLRLAEGRGVQVRMASYRCTGTPDANMVRRSRGRSRLSGSPSAAARLPRSAGEPRPRCGCGCSRRCGTTSTHRRAGRTPGSARYSPSLRVEEGGDRQLVEDDHHDGSWRRGHRDGLELSGGGVVLAEQLARRGLRRGTRRGTARGGGECARGALASGGRARAPGRRPRPARTRPPARTRSNPHAWASTLPNTPPSTKSTSGTRHQPGSGGAATTPARLPRRARPRAERDEEREPDDLPTAGTGRR